MHILYSLAFAGLIWLAMSQFVQVFADINKALGNG